MSGSAMSGSAWLRRWCAWVCAAPLLWCVRAHAQPAADVIEVVVDAEVKPADTDVAAGAGAVAGAKQAAGEEDEEALPPPPIDVAVFGRKGVSRLGGSAHRLDEKTLERFEDDNIHTILKRVPGVYVRGEDGYGLRPNIGLRGANSDRSKKITLLEDGVLFGPAPYAAPAAYYFPLTTRMVGIEVFKGASALRYGPNTIGGTINLKTRAIPYGHLFGADLAAGSYLYGKGHGYYGYGNEYWGVLVEGVRLRSNGFKRLDAAPRFGARPNTGFDKMELMLKARVNTDPSDTLYQQLSLKLGYSRETSNETYLGLSDEDFRADPYRRYAASQLDHMKWHRFQLELSHDLVWQKHLKLHTVMYRHDFSRGWFKLNRFARGPELYALLRRPQGGIRQVFYGVLRGAQNSASDAEQLMVGANDRTFVAQGIQSSGRLTLPKLGPVQQRIRFGARLHHDQIQRNHSEQAFAMVSGVLTRADGERLSTADNTGSALAFSASVVDEIALARLYLTPGVRIEYITTTFVDRLGGIDIEGKQHALLPGIGAVYQFADAFGVLAGVHEGFSPVAPGQGAQVKPEVAINYEAGARLSLEEGHAEVVGFVSDYTNLTGQCSLSSCGTNAPADKQFNGGEALIAGVEVSADTELTSDVGLTFPLALAYTFTHTEFTDDFTSSNPQWGGVKAGDRLPYVPTHQLALTAGLLHSRWGGLNVSVTHVAAMLEAAGQGDVDSDQRTDAYTTLEATASFNISREMSLYLKGDNLLNSAYLVSRRPFGARPGSPRLLLAGVKVTLSR